MINVTSIIKLTNNFDLIQQVREKLARQYEPAVAEKLAEILDELAIIVSALDDEIVRYLSLSFNNETVIAGRTMLLDRKPVSRLCAWAKCGGTAIKSVRDAHVQLTEAISSLSSMQAEFITVTKTI